MGLEKVIEDIGRNAGQEAERIISQGKEEADGILRETRQRIAQRKKEMEAERDSQIEQLRKRSEIKTRLDRNNAILNARKEAIDGVYGEFLRKVSSVKGAEREKLYKKMFLLAKKDLEKPKTVYVPQQDMAMARKLFKGLQIKKGEDIPGIVLESGDGREFIDFRLDTLAEIMKAKTLKQVSDSLFRGQETR